MASFSIAIHNSLTTPTTISTTTSNISTARPITINDKFDLLQSILDLATTRPSYNLEIRGTHRSGDTSVTDFDFNYEITDYLVREASYIVVPWSPSSTSPRGHEEIRLDIAALTSYVEERSFAPNLAPLSIADLERWATGLVTLSRQPIGRGRAGISFTNSLDTAPDRKQITTLAQRIAYGGHVSCKLSAAKPECELISFNSSYTPSSQQCLHLRSVWKFIPVVPMDTTQLQSSSSSADWEILEKEEEIKKAKVIPEWELDIQQAMACKKTDWLTDDDIALLVGLPIKTLVYNLNLSSRRDKDEEERDVRRGSSGMRIDDRLLWGCDEFR